MSPAQIGHSVLANSRRWLRLLVVRVVQTKIRRALSGTVRGRTQDRGCAAVYAKRSISLFGHVGADLDLSCGEVDGTDAPNPERVHPAVDSARRGEFDVLAEQRHGRTRMGDDHSVRSERDHFTVARSDRRFDVEFASPVRTQVRVVHAAHGAREAAGRRPFERYVDTQTRWRRRSLSGENRLQLAPNSVTAVIFSVYSYSCSPSELFVIGTPPRFGLARGTPGLPTIREG